MPLDDSEELVEKARISTPSAELPDGPQLQSSSERSPRLHAGAPAQRGDQGQSDGAQSEGSAAQTTPSSHREVRTLPSWIDSVEVVSGADDEDNANSNATDRLLPRPPATVSAQHHYAPVKESSRVSKDGYVDPDEITSAPSTAKTGAPDKGLFGTSREPGRGRKWDYARESEPVVMQSHPITSSPWSMFAKSSRYGPPAGEQGPIVDPHFLEELTPGYAEPWVGDLGGEDPEQALGLTPNKTRRRLVWYQRAQRSILMHPLVPLAFRLTVLATSVIALGLSASIYHYTVTSSFPQTPSAVMAIVVDVIALPYIVYITWDEYTGKPLGLRRPKSKVRLVLLDVFFIIFESANLALAFETINDDDNACVEGADADTAPTNALLCHESEALAAILVVALLAWTMTFTVSVISVWEGEMRTFKRTPVLYGWDERSCSRY